MKRERLQINAPEGTFYVDKELEEHIRLCQSMFAILKDDLVYPEKIKLIMFGYDDMLDKDTIMLVTHRGTCFRGSMGFSPDMGNYRDVLFDFIANWNKIPKEESDKEQYEGIWKETGKRIQFNRVFADYRFSDVECEELLAGETITIQAPKSDGSSGETEYKGKLAEQQYKGFRYFGFMMVHEYPPTELLTVPITEEQQQALADGKQIFLKNMWSEKKQKHFSANISWSKENGIQFHFNR